MGLNTKIQGHCPMGCGETLEVPPNGYIACSATNCPRPTAAHEILSERDEHIVEITDDGFTILHPSRERLDNGLFSCKLQSWMAELNGPPHKPGRYRVSGPFAHPADGQTEYRFQEA